MRNVCSNLVLRDFSGGLSVVGNSGVGVCGYGDGWPGLASLPVIPFSG